MNKPHENNAMGDGKINLLQAMTTPRKKLIEILGQIAFGATVGLLMAWLFINAITQCGETTLTVDDSQIKGECILVPWVKP